MAQYYDDFSGNSPVGGAPVGWTERWHTSGTTFTTVADADAEGGVCMRLDVTSSQRTMWSFDAVDSESPDTRDDFEILVKYKSSDMTDSGYKFGPCGRASGTSTSETGYVAHTYGDAMLCLSRGYNNASSFEVEGTNSNLTGHHGNTSTSLPSNVWYWIRFRVNGTDIKWKFWATENSFTTDQWKYEPDEWHSEKTDSTLSAAGWLGLMTFDNGAGPYDIAYFSCGTNGDIAPYPGSGTGLQTYRMTQQSVFAAVAAGDAEIRVQRQTVHVLTQLNTPVVSGAKRRLSAIAM